VALSAEKPVRQKGKIGFGWFRNGACLKSVVKKKLIYRKQTTQLKTLFAASTTYVVYGILLLQL